jgi:hypothetical protein
MTWHGELSHVKKYELKKTASGFLMIKTLNKFKIKNCRHTLEF